MINTAKAKWDLSKEEKYAVNWFNKHGFDGEIEKQYLSKTKFIISKNGVTDRFELPQGIKNINTRKIMDSYEKSFNLLCELEILRKQINS